MLREPGRTPEAFATGVTDAGIGLELIVWIGDGEKGFGGLRTAILARALASFARAGIALPVLLRDLRVPFVPSAVAAPDKSST